MANMKMNMPAELSTENERLLAGAGYLWDNWVHGFRRVREIGSQSVANYLAAEPDIISVEELTAHGCFDPDASLGERNKSEVWLHTRVKAGKPLT